MSREDPQLKLRLTEEMKARITRAAKDNGRSVNSEIVARLTDSFDLDAVTKTPEASYDAIKPLMDMLKVEFANLYEDKLEALRKQLSEISSELHAQRNEEGRR